MSIDKSKFEYLNKLRPSDLFLSHQFTVKLQLNKKNNDNKYEILWEKSMILAIRPMQIIILEENKELLISINND